LSILLWFFLVKNVTLTFEGLNAQAHPPWFLQMGFTVSIFVALGHFELALSFLLSLSVPLLTFSELVLLDCFFSLW
jgi:hypothetical protein